MNRFSVISLFPEIVQFNLEKGVTGQALKKNVFALELINPRLFTNDVHKTVDDRPFGGGDGMVMLAEPLEKAIKSVQKPNSKVVFLSPQGRNLTADLSRELSHEEHLILVSGRYSGIDQRLINKYVDLEISVGDYVVSGGELPVCLLIDSVARFIPGVLGHAMSAAEDSFSDGMLEAPQFTRPARFLDQEVPEVLSSGNHAKIKEWKEKMSLVVTWKKKPELLSQTQIQQAKAVFEQLAEQDRSVLGLKGKISE